MEQSGARRWLTIGWGLVAALFAVRFFRLRADAPLPPEFRLVRDGVLYTDEGWYAGNALMLFRTGQWYIPGDMNFAVVLPLQQLLYLPVFAVMGPTIEAVRLAAIAAFAACVVLTALIVRRLAGGWPALLAAALMTVNFMLFAYSRLGLSENLMVALQLGAVLTAMAAGAPGWRGWAAVVGAAALCVAALLTKTSAAPGFPIIVAVVALSAGRQWMLRGGVTAVLIMGLYLGHKLVVRALFPEDVRFFHSINIGMQLDLDPYRAVMRGLRVFDEATQRLDGVLRYALPIGLLVLALLHRGRRLWIGLGLLAVYTAGYLVMLSVYDNLQPRYWVPFGAVGAMACALVAWGLWQERQRSRWIGVLLVLLGLMALAGTTRQVVRTTKYLTTTRESFSDFASALRQIMENELPGERVLLGHISHQLALFEPFVPVNDLYGAAPLEERLDRFSPRFLVTQGPVVPLPHQRLSHLDRNPADYMLRHRVLSERYIITELGVFDVLGNYRRLPLHVYRLDPKAAL
jgi:hypothetical protein